ncbi:pks3 [Symbiodinium microadriaticum]|nr:pks3 [Symbiodinium microadriaticum]
MQVTRDGQHGRNASGGSYWQWLDKAYLALQAASQVPRARLLWHRVPQLILPSLAACTLMCSPDPCLL